MRVPPKATPVWFFEHGNKNSDPFPAIVLESATNGVCRIGIFPRQGGDIVVRNSVYHISDVSLKDRDGSPTLSAIRNGAWDYHPWFSPPGDDEPLPQDAVEKVTSLAKEFDFDTVCKKVRNLGLSKSAVARIYEGM
jgi:hypothetical protein